MPKYGLSRGGNNKFMIIVNNYTPHGTQSTLVLETENNVSSSFVSVAFKERKIPEVALARFDCTRKVYSPRTLDL